jgi:hypothetical protein
MRKRKQKITDDSYTKDSPFLCIVYYRDSVYSNNMECTNMKRKAIITFEYLAIFIEL